MKRRNFLKLLGSGTAAAAHTPGMTARPGSGIQVQSSREPLEIGSEKQLFLDDHVIESMEPRVFQLLNQPIKYRENPVIPLGTDWEQKGGLSHGGDAGTIFYDEDQKLYRFYDWMIEWPSQRRFLQEIPLLRRVGRWSALEETGSGSGPLPRIRHQLSSDFFPGQCQSGQRRGASGSGGEASGGTLQDRVPGKAGWKVGHVSWPLSRRNPLEILLHVPAHRPLLQRYQQ